MMSFCFLPLSDPFWSPSLGETFTSKEKESSYVTSTLMLSNKMGRAITKYVVSICFLVLASYISIERASQTFGVAQSRSIKSDATGSGVNDAYARVQVQTEPVLPKKIISVIGLESSGTQFMTDVLAKALGVQGKYREGSFNNNPGMNDDSVQLQHFSLPWGSTCVDHPKQTIQKVVLPFPCEGTYQSMSDSCKEWARDANMDGHRDKPIYPARYFLDIIASKEFYESKGIEQVFVIVLRDRSISFTSRKGHCSMTNLREAEEDFGTDIIVRAINKYILNITDSRELSHESLYNEALWGEYGNDHGDGERRRLASSLPSGDNVFLVSYESLLKLKDTYIAMIYDALGIESDYMPTFKDGNQKYVSTAMTMPKLRQQNLLRSTTKPHQHATQKERDARREEILKSIGGT